jgi:hypothetical protein
VDFNFANAARLLGVVFVGLLHVHAESDFKIFGLDEP